MKKLIIEMFLPAFGLCLMMVFLFVLRISYKSMVSDVSNWLITEKQYVDVEVTYMPKSNVEFEAKDGKETVIVNADDLKACDIHVGDKVNVMKYKSWAVNSPNDNGYRYDLIADNGGK